MLFHYAIRNDLSEQVCYSCRNPARWHEPNMGIPFQVVDLTRWTYIFESVICLSKVKQSAFFPCFTPSVAGESVETAGRRSGPHHFRKVAQNSKLLHPVVPSRASVQAFFVCQGFEEAWPASSVSTSQARLMSKAASPWLAALLLETQSSGRLALIKYWKSLVTSELSCNVNWKQINLYKNIYTHTVHIKSKYHHIIIKQDRL